MTTVVYYKGILAADSRATTQTEHTCSSCNTTSRSFRSSEKIFLNFDPTAKYRDEMIIAVGVAGTAHLSRQAIDLLFKGENIDQVYRNTFLVTRPQAGAGSFSLLIVTKSRVVKFSCDMEVQKVRTNEYKRDGGAFIGSGSSAAKLALVMFGTDAIGAVKAAMLGDEHTGGHVRWVDCNAIGERVSIEMVTDEHIKKEFPEQLGKLLRGALVEKQEAEVKSEAEVPKKQTRRPRATTSKK